ncbi:MAG: class I SAM-dependent methyltransferase [Planctomycetota bacterium]|nr:class I SAM-dependent methyltransferase [Planctomycetota bacterium]
MNSFANGDPRERQLDGLEIFKTWDIYERIIHGNWMCHRELRSAIQETLDTGFRAIKVLDVASGDGRMAYAGLETAAVAKYVALDLSQPALESLQ